MIVALTMLDGRVMAKPASFLPPREFERYRLACDAGGAMFDRETKSNMAQLGAVPKLVEALKNNGFEARLRDDVKAALAAMAKELYASEKSAGERVEAVGARMALHGLKLFPFQEIGVRWLAPRQRGMLCDDPGLGKTCQLLAAAPVGPVFVVAPAVAKGVWQREALRWRPDLSPGILNGRKSFRWPAHGEILISNYDILPPLEEEDEDGEIVKLKPFENCPQGVTLIADEAHAAKSNKSQRTQRLRKMVKAVLANGGRVWAATGTPLMNRPEELASLLTTFGLFQECFGTWTRYLRVMQGRKAEWGGFNWGTPTPAAIDDIRRVMLRRRREEVLPDLPTKIYQQIDVDIDAATMRACEEARELLQSRGVSLEQAVFESNSLGVAFEQIARLRKALATAKLPALLELLPEYEEAGEPVLVFSAHRAPIDALASRPGWAVITGDTPAKERTKIEDIFQSGALKGVAGTIEAMGVSITLTRAHQAIFVDLEWTPAANGQAEDRICRIGQSRGVVIKTLIAPDTFDQEVVDLLRRKQKIIDSTINAAASAPDATNRQDAGEIARLANAPTQGELI